MKHLLIRQQINGLWLILLMGRFSMLRAWYDLIKSKVRPNREFVSVDAARTPVVKDQRSYEMLASNKETTRSPDAGLTPLTPAARSGRGTPDYFGREAKYQNPTLSFSSPKPPHGQGRQWSPSVGDNEYRMDPLSMNKI
jgi:hypothetical protein